MASAGPVLGQISVGGELRHIFDLEPGERAEGALTIHNNSTASQRVKVYLNDYLFYLDGSNVYGEPGSVPRSCAAWLTLAPKHFTIPAKDEISVDYVVTVPDSSALTGSYWCMVMVEPVDVLEPPAPAGNERSISIRTVIRYGVQFVIDIGGGEKKIDILDGTLIAQDSGSILQLDVENTGQRWINPRVWTEIYRDQGSYLGRSESEHQSIYPGCSVRYSIPLDLVAGDYFALVVIDDRDGEAWGAQYNIRID